MKKNLYTLLGLILFYSTLLKSVKIINMTFGEITVHVTSLISGQKMDTPSRILKSRQEIEEPNASSLTISIKDKKTYNFENLVDGTKICVTDSVAKITTYQKANQ